MKGISSEENRRFEELVGTLTDVEKRVVKQSNKKRQMIIWSSTVGLIGIACIVASVSMNVPAIGVLAFLATVLGLNFILERFSK